MQHLNPDFNVDSFSFNFSCNGFVIPNECKAFINFNNVTFSFDESMRRENGSIIVPAQTNARYSADFHPSELEFEIPYLEVTNIIVDGKTFDTEALFLRECLITQNCQPISQPYIDAYVILKEDMDKVRSIFENMVDTMIQIYFDPEDKQTIARIEASVERLKRNSVQGAFGDPNLVMPRTHHSLHDAPLCDDFEDLERDYD